MQTDWCIQRGRDILSQEISGLQAVSNDLGEEFEMLVQACLKTGQAGGKIVACGIGKSGYIGAKISATLASTGSPSVFLHPVEAMHGDLGILSANDLLLTISYSGESEELLALLPAAKRLGVMIVGISRSRTNSLEQWCDFILPMEIGKEACPFNLAPTTSTTALAALGDALALVLLEAKGFSEKDYALLHPSGAIGRTMTLKVEDIMRTGKRLARVGPETKVKEGLIVMTRARSGCVAVIDEKNKVLGIFTDGDFRRHITNDTPDLLERPVSEVMTRSPVTVNRKTLAVEMPRILEQKKIDDILVVDNENYLTGIVDVQDLPKFKLI